MNIPEDCKHRSRFKKDCCKVIWDGIIVEHDGCVANGGCDLVAYDDHRMYFIEIKGGSISSEDAKKIIEQIQRCESWYSGLAGHRRKSRLFLRCINGKKKRFDSGARSKLINAKIRIYDCRGWFDLNRLK